MAHLPFNFMASGFEVVIVGEAVVIVGKALVIVGEGFGIVVQYIEDSGAIIKHPRLIPRWIKL